MTSTNDEASATEFEKYPTSDLDERKIRAVQMRVAGMSATEIARHFNVSIQTAFDWIKQALMSDDHRVDVEELRRLEGLRLDAAQSRLWPQVLAGDTKATDTLVRLSARRARMFGLDAPVDVRMTAEIKDEMERAFAELERYVQGEVVEPVRDA